MDALRNITYDNEYRKTSVLSINRVPIEDFTEVATLSEAKAQCRVDFSDEDTIIGNLIPVARGVIESKTGLALVQSLITVVLDNAYGKYRLPYGPYEADSVLVKDADGNTVAATGYEIISESGGVYLDYQVYGVTTITYNAGFSAATLPPELKQAVLFYVQYMYDPVNGKDAKEIALGLAKSKSVLTWLI